MNQERKMELNIETAHDDSCEFAEWLSMLDKKDLLNMLDNKTRDDLIGFIGLVYLRNMFKEELKNV